MCFKFSTNFSFLFLFFSILRIMNSQKFRYSFLIFYFIVQSKSQDSFLLTSFFHLIYTYIHILSCNNASSEIIFSSFVCSLLLEEKIVCLLFYTVYYFYTYIYIVMSNPRFKFSIIIEKCMRINSLNNDKSLSKFIIC